MPRHPRVHAEGLLYHVIARGNNGQKIFVRRAAPDSTIHDSARRDGPLEGEHLMKLIVLILFKLVILIPSLSWATQSFDFMSAVISALEHCRIARYRINESRTTDLMQRMTEMQIFASQFRRAKTLMEPYTRSQNELIRTSAESFSIIFSGFVANTHETLSLLEDSLNNPLAFPEKQGTFMRKSSENLAEADRLWRALMEATVLSTCPLVDTKRTVGGKLTYLTITSTERDQLRAALRSAFGAKVVEGAKPGQFPIEACGGLLWDFLAKPFKPLETR